MPTSPARRPSVAGSSRILALDQLSLEEAFLHGTGEAMRSREVGQAVGIEGVDAHIPAEVIVEAFGSGEPDDPLVHGPDLLG